MAKHPTNQWTLDPREALRVGPGFDLATFDRASTPGWEGDKAAAEELTDARGALMSELQERLFAEGRTDGRRSVLAIIQGLDTAGKGGIVRHVMGYVDPQGVALRSFGVPTAEERAHPFLWRIRQALPKPGYIGVFDRSQYEDVLVVRVDELVPRTVWSRRYAQINSFEKSVINSGTTIVKFALMVSHEEQGKRLMERLDRPDKHWKYKPGDLDTRAKWVQFQEAYQAVFDKTSTADAPWYVIPADNKWYARLAITEILTRTLIEMDLGWPEAEFDVAEQRRLLAESMKPADLRASLADTKDAVTSGIEDMVEVGAESMAVLGEDDTETQKRIDERRAAMLASLTETIAQKEQLLAELSSDDEVELIPEADPVAPAEAADDAEPASAKKDKKPKKGKGDGKKSKKDKDKKKK